MRLERAQMPDLVELRSLHSYALGWPTCACGQLDERIPRSPLGEPFDQFLCEEGTDFSSWVGLMFDHAMNCEEKLFEQARAEALNSLCLIERREVELIADLP